MKLANFRYQLNNGPAGFVYRYSLESRLYDIVYTFCRILNLYTWHNQESKFSLVWLMHAGKIPDIPDG